MAALLLRLLHHLFPEVEWQFVYVDDFAWLLREDSAGIISTAILATMIAMGVPLSWKKTEMNHTIKWLGFMVDIN